MHLRPIASGQHPTPLSQLQLHPKLPLVAAANPTGSDAHLWTWKDNRLQHIATFGDGSERQTTAWRPPPAVKLAWHPTEPLLAAATLDRLRLWRCSLGSEPAAFEIGVGALACDSFSNVIAFDIRGRGLWAGTGTFCDWIDLHTLHCSTFKWRWDTDLAHHPEGEIFAVFESDQNMTLVKFSRLSQPPGEVRVQTQRRALALDADGYEGLLFSPRGDRVFFQGHGHGFLHDFPTLRRRSILAMEPFETFEKRMPRSWSKFHWMIRRNAAFAPDGLSLLFGLSTGHLAELDLQTLEPRSCAPLFEEPLVALQVRRDGLMAATDASGMLRVDQLPHEPVHPDQESQPLTRAFLAATRPTIPYPEVTLDGGDDFDLTDGLREWNEQAFSAPSLPDNAPGWARLGHTLRTLSRRP